MDLGKDNIINYDDIRYVIVREISHLRIINREEMMLKLLLRICILNEGGSKNIYVNIPCSIKLIDFVKNIIPLSSFCVVRGVKFPYTMLDHKIEFSSSGGEILI